MTLVPSHPPGTVGAQYSYQSTCVLPSIPYWNRVPNRVLCGTGFTEYQNRYFRDESMDECKTDAFRERIHNGWYDKAYFCFIMTERTVETFLYLENMLLGHKYCVKGHP